VNRKTRSREYEFLGRRDFDKRVEKIPQRWLISVATILESDESEILVGRRVLLDHGLSLSGEIERGPAFLGN
jgi:hypothetical protein